MAKRPFAAEPVVTIELEPLVIVITPLLLDVPARIPALMPYMLLLSMDEALPLVVMLTVPTVKLPELLT